MLEDTIASAIVDASMFLPEHVEDLIKKAAKSEKNSYARFALSCIVENINLAREKELPLCQDTGMLYVFVEVGKDARFSYKALSGALEKGIKKGMKEGAFRESVVSDPVFDRKNTNTNLPPVINYFFVDGSDITLTFLLKGFGSENCSGVRMIRPTDGKDGVIDAVIDIVKSAGGKPCPPMFLGIGVGGTMDRAAILSKKALVYEGKKDKRYKELEEEILGKVNALRIGASGLGGANTALSCSVLYEPTHIAALPVAVSINCWADRFVKVVVKGGFDEEDA